MVPTDFPVKQTLGFELEVVLLIPHLVLFIHSITMLPVCLIEDLLSTKQSYSHLAEKEDDFYSLIFVRENCSQRISDNCNSIQHLTFFVFRDTQCYLHLENHQPPKNRLRLGVAGKVRLSQNKLLPYNLHKTAKKALYLSVNVFSTKVLTGDTMLTSPTGDGTAILLGHQGHAKV